MELFDVHAPVGWADAYVLHASAAGTHDGWRRRWGARALCNTIDLDEISCGKVRKVASNMKCLLAVAPPARTTGLRIMENMYSRHCSYLTCHSGHSSRRGILSLHPTQCLGISCIKTPMPNRNLRLQELCTPLEGACETILL